MDGCPSGGGQDARRDVMKAQRVSCELEILGEFEVIIGLKQGNALIPLLFIAVVDLISRNTGRNDILRKLCYARSGSGSGRREDIEE